MCGGEAAGAGGGGGVRDPGVCAELRRGRGLQADTVPPG